MILVVFYGVLVEMSNSVLEDESVLWMDFGVSKTSIEVIREGPFGSTYFRNIYSDFNGKQYRTS